MVGPKVIRSRLGRGLLLIALIAACSLVAPPTEVIVLHSPPGDHALHEHGRRLKGLRWELDAAQPGLNRGFFVVKSELEWRTLWPKVRDDQIPILPRDLDFSREMLLVSSPAEENATSSEIKDVIETESRGVHVYLTQELLGVDCPPREADSEKTTYDFVRVPRIDGKEVRFYVDTTFGEPCGKPPIATITCHPNGTTTPFVEKLSVTPSTDVACITSSLSATRPVFDRTWSFASAPGGTFTRIAVNAGGHGATFKPDLFGTYRLMLETTDDLSRRGRATIDVDVTPPKESLTVQMAWKRADPNDDPSTFPRVELHVVGLGSQDAPRSTTPSFVRWGAIKDCSADNDKPPPWCNVKAVGTTTVALLDPLAARDYALAVRYVDERVLGQPTVCIRAFRNGKMQTELCDPSVRKDGSFWEAGSVDAASGKTLEALAQEQAIAAARTPPPAQVSPDAGARDASAGDGSSGDASAARGDAGAGEGGPKPLAPSSKP